MKSKAGSRSSYNLLLFRTSELTQNSLCDGGGRLNGQRVHEHGRGGRHLGLRGALDAAGGGLGWRSSGSLYEAVVNNEGLYLHTRSNESCRVP